jgi:Sodium:sulfate symporter transmembrane region
LHHVKIETGPGALRRRSCRTRSPAIGGSFLLWRPGGHGGIPGGNPSGIRQRDRARFVADPDHHRHHAEDRDAGINVLGMTLLLQFVVSFGFILPVNSPQGMVAYGTETFEVRDFVRTGLVLTVAAYVLTLVFGATYWRWLRDM